MNIPGSRSLLGEAVFFWILGTVFWPYFAGAAILAAGIFASSKEFLRARGVDRILGAGPLFFAAPMAVFASQHFTEAKAVATIVPSWLPGHLFWTYFIGAAIIAASLSMVLRIQARLAALLLGALLILFVLLLHIPSIMAEPKNVIAWAIGLRDLAFSAGALAFAGTGAEIARVKGAKILVTLVRVFLAVAVLYYGVVHFVHPEFMPGIDFDRSVPSWIPLRTFWSYFAGTIFLITGACLIANRKTRLAAIGLGITVLVLILFVYLPILVAHPMDIDNGLNFLVSMLAFGGVALLVARAMPGDGGNIFSLPSKGPVSGSH